MTDAEFQRYIDSLPDDLAGFNDVLAAMSDAEYAAFMQRSAALPKNQGGSVNNDSWYEWLARGAAQGSLNLVNGVQDTVVGAMNLPIMAMNGSFWLQEQLGIFEDAGRLPYYQLPEWSKDLLVHEAPLARDINKAVGGALLGAGVAKATKFLKPVVTKVDDAAGAAGSATRSATGVSRPGSVSGNPANRLVETRTPLKDGFGWRKRWYRMTETDYNAYQNAVSQRYDQLLLETANWHKQGIDRSKYIFEQMSEFRTGWLDDFLQSRGY